MSHDAADRAAEQRPVLVTGGAGFVGTNLVARLLDSGREVIVYDNLSRQGAYENLQLLSQIGNGRLGVCLDDMRNPRELRRAVRNASFVFHLAAREASNFSLDNPLGDAETNLYGTLNLLEAIRRSPHRPPLVFASTSKVYGDLRDVALAVASDRYQPEDPDIRLFGISEARPLDFCGAYACSKGAADQYALDYGRDSEISTVVLRLGCVYGPHQLANENQGWLAHFVLQALRGHPITIFGDGLQVRDVLHVDDMVDALLSCAENVNGLRGHAFNVGGGTANTISLQEALAVIGRLRGAPLRAEHAGWRAHDQRYFVSDTRRFGVAARWRPRIDVARGIASLYHWFANRAATSNECAERAA